MKESTPTHRIITLAVDMAVQDVDNTTPPATTLQAALPGVHILNDQSVTGVIDTEWAADNTTQPDLPMTFEQARNHVDDDGYATVILLVDQQDYMRHVIEGIQTVDADNELDLVHNLAFTFDPPRLYDYTTTYEDHVEIVGVAGDDFVVSYTTKII